MDNKLQFFMLKISTLVFIILLFFSGNIFAGGGITHMFIAQQIIRQLPDKELQNLLFNNFDAYLVGSYYPDSGYVESNSYGEDSHWDPFIYTFADYLKEKYSDPIHQNPKLVAFLLGCATHRVSDEIIHWTFYNVTKDKDFGGNWDKAHQNGDAGIDAFLYEDKKSFIQTPSTWWVPVSDLLQVYHRMGKDQYTENEIIYGNKVISAAQKGEEAIAIPSYEYYKWLMPWTYAHYYNWPEGGILMDEQKVISYSLDIWQRLKRT